MLNRNSGSSSMWVDSSRRRFHTSNMCVCAGALPPPYLLDFVATLSGCCIWMNKIIVRDLSPEPWALCPDFFFILLSCFFFLLSSFLFLLSSSSSFFFVSKMFFLLDNVSGHTTNQTETIQETAKIQISYAEFENLAQKCFFSNMFFWISQHKRAYRDPKREGPRDGPNPDFIYGICTFGHNFCFSPNVLFLN